jgi:hypothetical protein
MINILALLVLLSYPAENQTWIMPEVYTYPEERKVLVAVPVQSVDIQVIK